MAFNPQALRDLIKSGSRNYRENTVSYIFYCPHCGKEKLYIRKSDGYFKCWVCAETQNFKGRVEYALSTLYGGQIEEYQRILRGSEVLIDRLDIMLADHYGEEEEFALDIGPELIDWEWSPLTVGPDEDGFEPGRQYLNGRGVSDAVIRKYGIRYAGWENRVLFPFVVAGRLVGWQGRLCGPSEFYDASTGKTRTVPKALTTIQDGVQGRYFMFGDNLVGSEHAVLCEGPVDALKADLCGGNVASLGKGVTQLQLDLLAKRVKKLYIALDPDAADDIMRIARQARTDMELYLLPPPEGCKDLGDATPEQVLEVFQKVSEKPMKRAQLVLYLDGKLCT